LFLFVFLFVRFPLRNSWQNWQKSKICEKRIKNRENRTKICENRTKKNN
jgi:hypothetical protein